MATKFKDVGKAMESQPEAHDMLRAMVERMVREVMEQEVEAHVGAGRYARGGERRGSIPARSTVIENTQALPQRNSVLILKGNFCLHCTKIQRGD